MTTNQVGCELRITPRAAKEFVDMCKSINNTLTDTIAAKKSLVKRLNLEIKSILLIMHNYEQRRI